MVLVQLAQQCPKEANSTVVNLLLCLMHKLNYIIDMYLKEKYSIYNDGYYLGFQASKEVLGMYHL